MEPELLKNITAPGSAAVLTFVLWQRLNRLESRLDAISDHIGAPRANSNRVWKKFSMLVLFAMLTVVIAGCANVSQTVTSADGSKTESHCLALWPATGALEKASVKQTKTTQAIGIEGASVEGGGTNMTTALGELRGILQIIARP